MARGPRIWYKGAIYHIMARGVRKKELFLDDDDRFAFLYFIRNINRKIEFKVHAYCLMTNHIHMIIECGDIEIGKIMKQILELYAMYFNRKYQFVGHLFEQRYKSCIIESDAYFIQTSRYIHLNPVKAHLTDHPIKYPWSSYKTIIGMEDDRITEINKTWNYFPHNPCRSYQEFVENTIDKEDEFYFKIYSEIGED